ncbi:MAG: hypothetical protein HC794_04670 [Nitrospiraceae bacterium]|nr:hypothetical protein [Nitrospiraceae bacterium]
MALSGCVAPTEPAELFALTPDIPKNRAMQTRMFETPNERELLSASAAVLQDLVFRSKKASGRLASCARQRNAALASMANMSDKYWC